MSACLLVLTLGGCGSPEALIASTVGGTVGATASGGASPAHEIEQIYYFGVFDPYEQLPPSVYRVTVRGQASLISSMRFASGWVPAQVVDTLSSEIAMDPDAEDGSGLTITRGAKEDEVNLDVGRRLVLFGPEGFRKSPKNYRLALVMGSSPEKFFQAVDSVLGAMDVNRHSADAVRRDLGQALAEIEAERAQLRSAEKSLKATEGGAG